MYVCLYVCMSVCLYVCMYVCTHVRIKPCMHACTCVCIERRLWLKAILGLIACFQWALRPLHLSWAVVRKFGTKPPKVADC